MKTFRVQLYQTVVEEKWVSVEIPDDESNPQRLARRIAEAAVFNGLADLDDDWNQVNVTDTGTAQVVSINPSSSACDILWSEGEEILKDAD